MRARTRARTKARERDSISRRREKSARARCTLVAHHLTTWRVTRRGSRLSSARHGRRLPDRAPGRSSERSAQSWISNFVRALFFRSPCHRARNRQIGDRSHSARCDYFFAHRSQLAERASASLSRADDAPCARGGSWGSVIDPKEIGGEETEATEECEPMIEGREEAKGALPSRKQ